jgi:cytochrome c
MRGSHAISGRMMPRFTARWARLLIEEGLRAPTGKEPIWRMVMTSFLNATVIAVAVLIGFGNSALAGEPAVGEASFKRHCLVCHSTGEGAKNKIGPFLNGLDGRKSGTIEWRGPA